MENKQIISGLTQETEQQSIQRRANRPRRQPVGVPDDESTAEMRVALGGASDTVEVARESNQLAPTTVLDNGDDGIIMEDYKALLDAAKSLTSSTEDTPAGALATGLLSAWEEQQAHVRMMKTEVEQIQREKDQTQTALGSLEDQLSVLRKDRDFKACKKQQRKWWKRFCMCGGFKKHNKVGVAQDQDGQTKDCETHFADQLAKQGSTIRSLHKDKFILESQIAMLKDDSEAAKRMVKEMAKKNKETEKERKQVEKEMKQVEKEQKEAEGEKIKAESEKEEAEKMKVEMEKKMRQVEKKKDHAERLNQILRESLNHIKQDIAQKVEQINDLHNINNRLQTVTDLKILQETKINVDRVVIGCLTFYTPQQLSFGDLMSFDKSSTSASQGVPILDMVGKGGCGEVMLARLNGEKDPIAIKRALARTKLTPEQEESDKKRCNICFEKEARAGLCMSTSPYFPRLLGVVMIDEDPCLVTEFIGDKIQGKSYILMDAIEPQKGCDPLPHVQKWNLVAIGEDIIRGVMDIHDRSLLHNDIKDDNVLLEFRKNRWRAVIIDLGMVSTVTYPYFSGNKVSLTSRQKAYFIHVAPEVIKGCDTSVASDIYSVGVILSTIGNFIGDDDLTSLGNMCSKEDPKERPDDLAEVLPGVVEIKEKHKALARLGGELVETDSEKEEDAEEGEEYFLSEEEQENGEEVVGGDGEEEGEEEDKGQQSGAEAERGAEEEAVEEDEVATENEDRYQVGGAGLVEELAEKEEEEEGEEVHVDEAGEEAVQVHQDERELHNGIDDEEGLDFADAVNPLAVQGVQVDEEGILEVGEERDGGEVEEEADGEG